MAAETLFQQLAGADAAERSAAASGLAKLVKTDGVKAFKEADIVEKLKAAGASKDANSREGVVAAFTALCQDVGNLAEPYLLQLVPVVLDLASDKAAPVRTGAEAAARALCALLCPHAIPQVLPALFEALDAKKLWQTKLAALTVLRDLTRAHPTSIGISLPEIVPAVTPIMNDVREQVKTAAYEAMMEACKNVGNRDVEGVVPKLVSCIARPTEVQDCVHALAATTFVQVVEAPTLSMLCPLLLRALRERVTAIKRKACLIIDNMSKLVEDPEDAVVFLPRLLPEVDLVASEVADPECRTVAARAAATLRKIDTQAQEQKASKKLGKPQVLAGLQDVMKKAGATLPAEEGGVIQDYVVSMATVLCSKKVEDADEWNKIVLPYLAPLTGDAQAAAVAKAFLDRCKEDMEKALQAAEEDDEEGEDLCNCEFSLAYGAKILLNNAKLHLKRGRRYGLCGPNGAGKSTLMRAINNGQVDGFPPKDVLRTMYVEHDIDGCYAEMSCVEFVLQDPELQAAQHSTRESVEEMLSSVGFTKEMQVAPVASLSGGWKMKLALARAMLMKADIMLLDEPTNHLDVKNVQWLMDYLNSLKTVTSIIVSHDSKFLDYVCTNIIHYEGRKLRVYKGNLSKFVEKCPEAKSYYSLAETQMSFKFPEPGFLEGVKTKDKAILKCMNVSFKYPNTERMIFEGASVYCSLNSRVACVGPNGAGKSTLVKVLTGETEPTVGTVWAHPNLRIAYVAQHAFHHVEQHLGKTPVEYIQWRFAPGEDREAQQKDTRQVTEEEKKKMGQVHVVDGAKRKVEKLLGRRKNKKDYEYEVVWEGLPLDQTTWLTRDVLEQMGFGKMVQEVDIKEAANMGLFQRPLTTANVQKHLEDLGLEAEFGTHSHIRGLSGGQKVKVVLAAATWQQPHLIVLDEPTNYLDRDSLGALANAIKDYGGGVVVISHHNEFVKNVCSETWTVGEGKVVVTGANVQAYREKVEFKVQEEMVDAFGNVIKIKAPPKKLSNKEKKARAKLRQARRDRGEEVSESEEDS